MNNTLVSVVVPVHNVERYLNACVDSILNQTFKKIEVILVDDGSTDSSPVICDDYAMRDKRVAVIHQENKGISDARNAGLAAAKGDWITFVDSDDMVAPNFINRLLANAVATAADISFCDYVDVSEDKNKLKSMDDGFVNITTGKECVHKLYNPEEHLMSVTTWGKLFHISLFRDNNITFPSGKIHEDNATTYKLFYFANQVVYDVAVGYAYRQREGSVVNSTFSLKRLDKLDALENNCTFFDEHEEPELLKDAFNALLHSSLVMLKNLDKIKNNKDRKEAKKRIAECVKTNVKKYKDKVEMSSQVKLFCNFGVPAMNFFF